MVSLPEKVDVAVIGAGLGGLTCAIELARQGLSVCVLEQHEVPGGYAQGFTRAGYSFDVSLHHVGGLDPGFMTHGILASLGVLDRLDLRRREELFRAELPDLKITLPNGRAEIIEALAEQFPGERSGIERLFAFLPTLKADVIGPTIDPGFDVASPHRLSVAYADRSFADLLLDHTSDPRLLTLLGQLWMQLGLPPSLSSANFAACVFCSSFIEGAYDVRGGGRAVTNALVARLEELGGQCLTRSRVLRVLVEGGEAAGLELEGGGSIRAGVVVSGVNPFQTFFDLVPEEAISRVFRFRVEQMEPSASFYSTYLGLDCLASEVGIAGDHLFVNHQPDLDDAYRRCLAHEIDRTDWSLSSAERSDPDASPSGGSVINALEITPARDWLEIDAASYRERKAEVGERLLRKLFARYPDLEGHIVVHELATPRTLHRYTSNHAGAAYGLAQTAEQSNSRRLRNRTPLRGLFLTGAWTWSGGGYEGAMMSGVQSARAVLDHLGAEQKAPPTRLHQPSRKPDSMQKPAPKIPEPVIGGPKLRDRVMVRVFGFDLGAQWITSPAAYLRFIDRGRVELIESLCKHTGEESWLTRYTINIYRLDAVFTGISRFGDRLEVQSSLRQVSSHRAAFDQRIYKAETRELLVDAIVEVLFLGPDGQLAAVPESLSGILGGNRPGPRPMVTFPAVRPGDDEEQYTYSVPFRVYYEDTDAQGIAYHASYARFSEGALVETIFSVLPRQAVGEWLDPNRIHLSRLGIRFLRATHLGDYLEVQTRGRQPTPGEMLVEQQILLRGTDIVSAQVVMEVGFVDQEGKRQRVPGPLQELIPYNPPK